MDLMTEITIFVLAAFVGFADDGVEYVIGTIAIAFGAINIVGGFMVTDRMLGMFSRKKKPAASSASGQAKGSEEE